MRREKVRRIWRWRYLLLLALPVAAAALACGGTLQIGIEFEEAPAGADVAEATPAGTVAALMAENVRLETQIAARAATSTPTPAPVVEAPPVDAGAIEAPPAAGSYAVLTIRGVVASVVAESNLVNLAAPVAGVEVVRAFEWTDIRAGDGQPAQIADLVPCTSIRAAGAQEGAILRADEIAVIDVAAALPGTFNGEITDADQLNLRAAPSPAAAILNTIPRGTRLTLVGQCGDWYAVVTPAGEQGWVAEAYVSVAGVGFSAESGAGSEALARNLPVIAASWPGRAAGASTPVFAAATDTYANPKLGFAFDYPARWIVDDAHSVIVLTSYDVSGAPGRDTIPIGQTKIEIVFSERGQGMGLEAMAGNARTEAAAAGGGVLWEQRWELADGVPAIRLQVMGPFGQVAGLYTVIGGRGLRMMGYGDLTRFDEIARTLRAYQ